MAFKLFELKEDELCLKRDEVLLIDAFAAIWRSDKGCKSDSDGRKHLLSYKIFKFIYLTQDPFAFPKQKGMTAEDAIDYALEESDITIEIAKQPIVMDACKYYSEHMITANQEMLYELKRGMNITKKVIIKMNDSAEAIISNTTSTKADLDDLLSYQERLSKLTTEVPTRIKDIAAMEKIVDKEEEARELLRGKDAGVVLDSMIPSKSY